jgi:hypothetical protein
MKKGEEADGRDAGGGGGGECAENDRAAPPLSVRTFASFSRARCLAWRRDASSNRRWCTLPWLLGDARTSVMRAEDCRTPHYRVFFKKKNQAHTSMHALMHSTHAHTHICTYAQAKSTPKVPAFSYRQSRVTRSSTQPRKTHTHAHLHTHVRTYAHAHIRTYAHTCTHRLVNVGMEGALSPKLLISLGPQS